MEQKPSSQMTPGSVTKRIPGLKAGDPEAEEWIWNRYFQQVAQAASFHLGTSPQTSHDEEDVAISVFAHFRDGVRKDKFRQLNNRSDLHQILLMLTRRRSIDYFRRATRRQQHEVGESGLGADSQNRPITLAEVASVEPPRDLVEEIAEEIRALFRKVSPSDVSAAATRQGKDPELETIALLRLEGLSTAEIGERIDCSTWSVYRRLDLIRRSWINHCREQDGESPKA